MSTNSLSRCRVCGLDLDEPPWGLDGQSPTFDYCPCCGVEFGYGDASPIAAKRSREAWLQAGASWSELVDPPSGWDLETQLAGIPEGFAESALTMSGESEASIELESGLRVFINQEVIMIKAVDGFGDPIELSEEEAQRLASWLASWSKKLSS